VQRVVVSVRRRGDGQASDFEVPTDVGAAELVAQLVGTLGEPQGVGAVELRPMSLGRALRPDETLADAGLWDGVRLTLARASDPLDSVTSLAVVETYPSVAVMPVPAPPVLVVPSHGAAPRSMVPFVALGAVLVALLAIGVWFWRARESAPTAAEAFAVSTPATPQETATPPPASSAALPPAATLTSAPTLTGAPTLASAPAIADDDTAWRELLAQLDSVWGVDWPASIGLLQTFHAQHPTRAAATEKLYAGLVEYARALREAGATSAAADELDQAVRLAPQRFEARDELAALRPTSTEPAAVAQAPTDAPTEAPIAARPVLAAPIAARPPTRAPAPTSPPEPRVLDTPPAPTPVPIPPVMDTPPAPTAPACDVTDPDVACPLADGSRVYDSILQPEGRHYYWFGVPTPGLQLRVEVAGPACPCTVLLFSDQVGDGRAPVAVTFDPDSSSTVLERLMPDAGAYLLELLPDQSNGADSDAAYALGFALRLPPTPTPVPVVEDAPPAPTLTPTPMPVPVPPVAAHSASGAVERLRAVGLVARTQSADRYSPAGPGTVAAQDPPAGSLLPPGSTVTLLVASGDVLVPDVVNLPEQDAWAALHEAGLQVETRRTRRSNVTAGRAAEVSPGAGAVVPAGSSVVLTISQGN